MTYSVMSKVIKKQTIYFDSLINTSLCAKYKKDQSTLGTGREVQESL
jgi:hypothetical protein